MTKRNRTDARRVRWRGALIPVLLLFATLPGCRRGQGPASGAPREAVRVTVLSPEFRELPRFVRATGTLFGDEETTVAAKVAGRVVEIARDLGDQARPGEVLARIDPTDYELARNERERAFREALASIGLEALPGPDFTVDGLPSVERARLQAANAQAKYERGKRLADRKPPLISEQDYADLKTAWDVAESNLHVERLSAETKLAEARTLEAQLSVAQQRVTDTVHRAPTDGAPGASGERVYEVAERRISTGDFVQIGTPLYRLVDSNPLKLRASIPERRLGVVKIGQTASVHVEALTGSFAGTVTRVSPAVDVASRSFIVEVVVPNAARLLKPGSFGVAEIQVGRERALVIPEQAVMTFAGVHKVIAVVEGKAQEKRVELGDKRDGHVEITRGLSETDVIVAKPSGSLTTGVPLIAQAPETGSSASSVGEAAR